MLKVSALWTYPIKSLGGIPIQSARVFQKGLESDRRWMLVDEENVFMTQRVHHKMALFRTSWVGDKLRVYHEGTTTDVPTFPSGSAIKAVIWDDLVDVLEVDEQISNWFSDRLG